MTAPFKEDKKIEILTYARDHGVVAASRHFGVSRNALGLWNRRLKIYTPQTAEYTPGQRAKILAFVRDNGVRATTKKFGVSAAIIKLWNQDAHVYAPKVPSFTSAQKMAILEYTRDFGPMAAANQFGVNPSTIIRWNKKYHVYSPLREYGHDDIVAILMHARDHGVADASRHFNVPQYTIGRWNKQYQIYEGRTAPQYTAFTPAQQREILRDARGVYDELPAHSRTARVAFMTIAPKYELTCDQLYIWNRKFHIVPVRPVRKPEMSQGEIDAVQTALNGSRGRVAATSRKTGYSEPRITKLKNNKRVSFNLAAKQVQGRAPVGTKKARLLGQIIGALQRVKE